MAFSGIRPVDVPGFVIAQLVGAAVGMLLLWMLAAREPEAGRAASAAAAAGKGP